MLATPSDVLSLHLKQTFPPKILIFTEGEGDGIKSRLPFKIFSTITNSKSTIYKIFLFHPHENQDQMMLHRWDSTYMIITVLLGEKGVCSRPFSFKIFVLFVGILVCLSKYWFGLFFQTCGLCVRNVGCLSELWFV